VDEAMVDQVRRFNRVVTQRNGALHDHFLSRSRPLGEARVLWEIGEGGRDVRTLRTLLDLDSGYLSRILRTLEADGLVRVGPSDDDKRVRTARLTKTGAAERAVLDRRSDAAAQSLLEPLTPAQRARLVAAMAQVERLLTASIVELEAIDPAHRDAQYCLNEYFADLNQRFDTGFDPERARPASAREMRPPAGVFVVATLRAEPIGCGGLKFHDDGWAELKRMWVAESVRGLGIGRRLLVDLEARAAAHASNTIRLDTNNTLTEAIAMYRSAGYREIPPFNDEPYAHHWFEKRLTATEGSHHR
jgi:DNA-binding MarR family transcriptional regulator/GNAT superfamily N-acetyltransferase